MGPDRPALIAYAPFLDSKDCKGDWLDLTASSVDTNFV